MADPIKFIEYIRMVEAAVCPNGVSRCVGITKCAFQGFDHIPCEIEKIYKVR